MNKFFKDYVELCKQTNNFYKDHWKGVIVVNVVVGGVMMAYICKGEIKEKIKNKFHKEKNADEEI